VLENLLTNAVKYSPAGTAIEVGIARVEMGQAGQAIITVRDHGKGIPATDLPHIFERFRRGGNVAGRFTGTGIGLWGSQRIVSQHGGSIMIESTEGQGTTVTGHLPLAHAAP
jgi:signal transduction histidine kinase